MSVSKRSEDLPLSGNATWSQAAGPALVVLLLGLAVVLLRHAIPLDEVRYVEVAREMAAGSPWLPTLNGDPYSHKAPGLIWAALLLHGAGLPIDVAMRVWPAVFSAATVVVVSRIGARHGLPHAGWIQATLLLPFLAAQVLLFDTMLAFAVWLALDGWDQGRRSRTAIGMILAFLAKGPVAFLFLIPFGWAFAPAGTRRSRTALAYGTLVAVALVPLLAWAIAAASIGGEKFAEEIFWKQSAGRVRDSFAHAQPPFFYLPVLVGGLLPFTPVLFLRGGVPAPDRVRRVLVAAAVTLAAFSLISGKQPHYMLPLAPAFALAVASKLERRTGALAWTRGTGAAILGVLAVAAAVLGTRATGPLSKYGEYGRELLQSGAWKALVLGSAAVAGLGVVLLVRARTPVRASASFLAGMIALVIPMHVAMGRVLVPQHIVRALAAEPQRPLAIYENLQAGFYDWALRRSPLENPRSPAALAQWFAVHPDGWAVVEDDELSTLPVRLEPVVSDLVRGKPNSIYRLAAQGSVPSR